MLQHIVRHRHQGVFLAVHRPVLAEHGQTVYVRVYHECQIVAAFLHQSLDVAQVLFQRFGVMAEIPRRLRKQPRDLLHS